MRYAAATGGLEPVTSYESQARQLYADLAAANVTYVSASEPLGMLANARLPGGEVVRGLTLKSSNLQPDGWVEALFPDEIPGVSRIANGPTGPASSTTPGLVLSGTLRRLFVLGGTTGSPAVANTNAWMLDLDTMRWTSYAIPPSFRPGEVRAATFRPADRRVYLVDRVAGVSRLRRWKPLEGFVTIARLPSAWDAFPRMWLTTGAAGELLLAATKTSSGSGDQYVLMRPSVSPAGAVTGPSIRRSTALRLANARPMMFAGSVNVVEASTSGGTLLNVGLNQFTTGVSPYGLLPP